MYLKVLDNFKQSFTPNMIDCKSFLKILSLEDCDDIPNIIIHGYDNLITELCMDVILKKLTCSKVVAIKDEKKGFPCLTHPNYILVDFHKLLYQQRIILFKYIEDLSKLECITREKHMVVLKNFDILTPTMMIILKNVLENPANTIRFVIICKNISYVNKSIVNSCLILRCVINIYRDVNKVLDLLGIQLDEKTLETCIQKSNGYISKFLIIIESRKKKFVLDEFISSKLKNIVNECTDKEVIEQITTTTSKLEISGVRPEYVCMSLINTCKDTFPYVDIACVVEVVTNFQVKILKSNKHTFLYEELFLRLYALIKSAKQ